MGWSVLILAFCAGAALADSGPFWVGSWAASQQAPEARNALDPGALRDATLRQIVHLSLGGEMLRLHLSNAFGTAPLHITSVHIARPASSAESRIDVATDRSLSFSGRADIAIPAGAEEVSDPLVFVVAAQSDLAITFHLDEPLQGETGPWPRPFPCLFITDNLVTSVLF
jgi:hypothetical protein